MDSHPQTRFGNITYTTHTQIFSTRWRNEVDWDCVEGCACWMSLTPKAFGPLHNTEKCSFELFSTNHVKPTLCKIHFFCQMHMLQMDLIIWCCWRFGFKYTSWVSLNANTNFSVLILNITYEYVLFSLGYTTMFQIKVQPFKYDICDL